jgi:hypothetical protein
MSLQIQQFGHHNGNDALRDTGLRFNSTSLRRLREESFQYLYGLKCSFLTKACDDRLSIIGRRSMSAVQLY